MSLRAPAVRSKTDVQGRGYGSLVSVIPGAPVCVADLRACLARFAVLLMHARIKCIRAKGGAHVRGLHQHSAKSSVAHVLAVRAWATELYVGRVGRWMLSHRNTA